jgi:RecB family exonuclease
MSENKQIFMSATRMSTYLTCKWKYWCGYVLHLPRKDNVSFKLGIAVHESLAKAGDIWKKKEQFTASDIRCIKDEYRKIAAREGIQNMMLYDDGLEMVLNRIDSFNLGNIITVEDNFKVTTSEGVVIIGAMDKVLELNEETILVVDYKTSKYFLTSDELKADIQLSIYDLVASIKFPEYKRIILSLDYLRSEPVYTYRTIKERRTFDKYLLAVYNEMIKLEEKDAKPAINDMCNWCDFKDSCPAYKDSVVKKSIFKKNLNEYDNDELVAEYLDVKNKARILYEYEKQLKTHIMQKIDEEESDLIGNGKQMYIKQNGKVSYDTATISKHVPKKDFLKMVTVGKKYVDEYLRMHPEVRPLVMETAQKSFTSPFLAYRTLKKK